MSRAVSAAVTGAVLVLHGFAIAALSTDAVTPPQLHSAPPIFGKLVTQPAAAPDTAPPPTPTPKVESKTPAGKIAPEPPTSRAAPEASPQIESVEAPEVEAEQQVAEPTVIPPRVDASGRDNPPPAYPAASRRAKEQGRVVLAIHIDARGRVTSARIQHSSGYRRLDQAALDAVRHWRYQPAMQRGQPIGFDYLQPVVFSLDQ